MDLSSNLSCPTRDFLFSITFFFIILLARAISVPFYPVPFTLQTFAIPLICLLSSSYKRVVYSLLIFGLYRACLDSASCLMSGGYIIGFFVMAYILMKPSMKKNVYTVASSVLFCLVLELLIGTIWLMMFLKPVEAFRLGFMFFIPAEFVKWIAVVSVYSLVKKVSFKTER